MMVRSRDECALNQLSISRHKIEYNYSHSKITRWKSKMESTRSEFPSSPVYIPQPYPNSTLLFLPIIASLRPPGLGIHRLESQTGTSQRKKLCSRLSPVAPFSPTLRAPIVLQHQHRQSRRLQEQLASDSHREQRQALTVSASLPAAPAGWNKKAAPSHGFDRCGQWVGRSVGDKGA